MSPLSLESSDVVLEQNSAPPRAELYQSESGLSELTTAHEEFARKLNHSQGCEGRWRSSQPTAGAPGR